MSGAGYRPICDTWILARPKIKYYGAYPSGFLERARALLGVGLTDCLLHVCGGKSKDYPFRGLGPNDMTLDIDKSLDPDIVCDIRKGIPKTAKFKAILADPPYSAEDAKNYSCGSDVYPSSRTVLRVCLEAVQPGGRVGILHYKWPGPPTLKQAGFDTRPVAVITVLMGYNNSARLYSVFERMP